ncbi:MAG: 1-acyl-sn-glycerol-3-phosphate acyltransferase [Bacteroidetes bacterium]|nr:MAG: 1-acyl-sn-glycerol-3-phosphate acyltransferase [Bacteroidota bacterium]
MTNANCQQMKRYWSFIVSLYFWVELFGSSAVLFPVALLIWVVTLPFDRRMYLLHQFSCLWANLAFRLNPLWHLSVTGKERIDPAQTYVMVSNHQSGADILVLFTLRLHFKWVAKRSLFFVPFVGWNMAMNRYIALRRGRKSSMQRMMEESKQALLQGNSLMIFPEGTRSKNGRLQSFKSGAFHLAITTRLPILPIAIKGTSLAIRKGGFLISRQPDLQAVILEPLPFESFSDLSPKELAESVYQKIEQELTSPPGPLS